MSTRLEVNKTLVGWASGALVLIALITAFAGFVTRLNAMETETKKVQGIEKNIQIITLYLKLQDPDLYKKAESLAH